MSDWLSFSNVITTPWGPIGLASLVSSIYLYVNLSRKLGAVTKMRPYYRWFLVGAGFIGLALVVAILRGAASLACREETDFMTSLSFSFWFYHIPLLIGTLISVVTVWRYWSWLLVGERE
jgi:hypothetical protein